MTWYICIESFIYKEDIFKEGEDIVPDKENLKITDISDYNDALKNLKASKGKTVSRENVLKELGLNQNNK